MTSLEFQTAAAGTGRIAAGPAEIPCRWGFILRQQLHDFGGRQPASNEPGQNFQRPVGVREKGFIARTQVIESGFATGGGQEPIFRAFSVAGKAHFAFSAGPRQCIPLVTAELTLLCRAGQFGHVGVLDVAQQIVLQRKLL